MNYISNKKNTLNKKMDPENKAKKLREKIILNLQNDDSNFSGGENLDEETKNTSQFKKKKLQKYHHHQIQILQMKLWIKKK